MERLTKRCNGVVTYIGTTNVYDGGQIAAEVDTAGVREVLERLAAYEDTGLTPAEVAALVRDWSDQCTIIGECGGLERVRELAEADKDGRVVVLAERPKPQHPCYGCSDGWGTAATTGVHTCHETCDRLKAYMEAGKDGR